MTAIINDLIYYSYQVKWPTNCDYVCMCIRKCYPALKLEPHVATTHYTTIYFDEQSNQHLAHLTKKSKHRIQQLKIQPVSHLISAPHQDHH